ncbi:hypothetical protein J8J40_23865, partial [Mycobacterium tuberculosis]|nr:hypothetical protein [Mycobacterium tuberculosis]MBP0650084.1 hypothetical protein [Mycobacterium tuberculosis]
HPTLGGPIEVRDGRYGPYVAHGKVYATLPKGMDPQAVTPEIAVALIAEKAAKSPAKAPARAKAAPAKAAAAKPKAAVKAAKTTKAAPKAKAATKKAAKSAP